MRRAARIDDNHREIVSALRGVGATVESLAGVGNGAPDLLVGWQGENILMEVKDGAKVASERKLRPCQVKWHQSWRGRVHTVESVPEALSILGVKRGT